MDIDKEKFKKICEENDNIPIFLQYNWYNSLFKEHEWDVVVEEQNNQVLGFMPYVVFQKYFFKVIQPAALTPFQGIWLNYNEDQKYTNRLSFEQKVMAALINRLPNVDSFKQKFYPEFANWLPFFWKGYKQTTRYTYVLEDISNKDNLFLEFRENIRREVRKGEKSLFVSVMDNIEGLFQLKVENYQEKGDRYPFSSDLLKKAFDFCVLNNCGEVITAKDNQGNIHSIVFYVWDKGSAYYLHGATNSKFKASGSMSLLLWEAIRRSSGKTKKFNFEGSMIEPIERYFRAFGGKQTPYFEISKISSKLLKLLNH